MPAHDEVVWTELLKGDRTEVTGSAQSSIPPFHSWAAGQRSLWRFILTFPPSLKPAHYPSLHARGSMDLPSTGSPLHWQPSLRCAGRHCCCPLGLYNLTKGENIKGVFRTMPKMEVEPRCKWTPLFCAPSFFSASHFSFLRRERENKRDSVWTIMRQGVWGRMTMGLGYANHRSW